MSFFLISPVAEIRTLLRPHSEAAKQYLNMPPNRINSLLNFTLHSLSQLLKNVSAFHSNPTFYITAGYSFKYYCSRLTGRVTNSDWIYGFVYRSTKSEKLYPSMLQRSEEVNQYYSGQLPVAGVGTLPTSPLHGAGNR